MAFTELVNSTGPNTFTEVARLGAICQGVMMLGRMDEYLSLGRLI